MENILDYNIDEKRNENVVFATFWSRVVASLVDALVVLILVPLTIYNLIDWKSVTILILTTGIGLSYKPFLEYKYGATLGKMAMKIRVTNYEFQSPNLQEILLRNIFNIIAALIDFILALYVLSLTEFKSIVTYQDYQVFITPKSSIFNIVIGLVTLVDIIFMFSDRQNRTLHDKIGKTLVVKRDSIIG